MQESDVRAFGPMRADHQGHPVANPPDDTERFCEIVPGLGRRNLRPSVTRLDGVVPATGRAQPDSRLILGRRQRASGGGGADGSTFGPASGAGADGGPTFLGRVGADGYRWWYVDGLSEDGQSGITIIAFIGSVFSPYYAWARRQGRGDPHNFCSINVALYGKGGKRWAMTERSHEAVVSPRIAFKSAPAPCIGMARHCASTSTKSPHLCRPVFAVKYACTQRRSVIPWSPWTRPAITNGGRLRPSPISKSIWANPVGTGAGTDISTATGAPCRWKSLSRPGTGRAPMCPVVRRFYMMCSGAIPMSKTCPSRCALISKAMLNRFKVPPSARCQRQVGGFTGRPGPTAIRHGSCRRSKTRRSTLAP